MVRGLISQLIYHTQNTIKAVNQLRSLYNKNCNHGERLQRKESAIEVGSIANPSFLNTPDSI